MRHQQLSRMMHGRPAATLMVLAAALAMLVAHVLGDEVAAPEAARAAPAFAGQLTGTAAIIINVVLMLGLMTLMVLLNRRHNILRAVTYLDVGLVALMQAAVPVALDGLNGGLLVAPVILLCMHRMFEAYADGHDMRGVFLSFLLLSAGASVEYAFVLFIPALWLMLAQMRIFTLRAMLASVMGIVTPWILLFGFGLVSPDDMALPHIRSIFSVSQWLERPALITAAAGFTALLLIGSVMLNVLKTIAYNARARAFNGALNLISAFAILAMVVDFGNLGAYLSLLNVCAAYQLTHYFVNYRYERQYLAVLAIAAIYILSFLWQIIL